ncbi:MAG: transglycosylase SLT domain-containing protein, partial [Myxococcota bacterium]|nr:transglycosylase SLT domain-containing protein [Myxococcota bacterium]
YRDFSEQPDPKEGGDLALWGLAQKAGLSSVEAYPYLRRIWTHYPLSEVRAQVSRALGSIHGTNTSPTPAEIALRADAWMNASRWTEANTLVSNHARRFTEASPESCMAWYAQGRSQFKRNQLSSAIEVLIPTGTRCSDIDEDRGARALYIAGKARERRKEWSLAAKVYQEIPELYPNHSMADDGYTLAGIAWQEAGDSARAMDLWEKQVGEIPEGDMAAEAFWRLAWNSYLAGETETAIQWAEQMLWDVELSRDPTRVHAAHYWTARWRVYPDVDFPTLQSTDQDRLDQGVRLWAQLCREYPHSFYSLLAASRLFEIAPQTIEELNRPIPSGDSQTWTVRKAFLDESAVDTGLRLARIGLHQEAVSELGTLSSSELTGSEVGVIHGIENRVDTYAATHHLHRYLLRNPPSTLGMDQSRLLSLGHPDLYWDLLQEVSASYEFDPRIFHALVREESSFNPRAVSFAGARGLSQLMPATARSVAGWLGFQVNNDQLFDPRTNLRIGSRYLSYLFEHYDGNPFMAVPAYNAGEGNVDRWLRDRGNRPTDEFVEDIPFRETRNYVKRVLGTYQTYHILYDPGPLFVDWSAYNHQAHTGR